MKISTIAVFLCSSFMLACTGNAPTNSSNVNAKQSKRTSVKVLKANQSSELQGLAIVDSEKPQNCKVMVHENESEGETELQLQVMFNTADEMRAVYHGFVGANLLRKARLRNKLIGEKSIPENKDCIEKEHCKQKFIVSYDKNKSITQVERISSFDKKGLFDVVETCQISKSL